MSNSKQLLLSLSCPSPSLPSPQSWQGACCSLKKCWKSKLEYRLSLCSSTLLCFKLTKRRPQAKGRHQATSRDSSSQGQALSAVPFLWFPDGGRGREGNHTKPADAGTWREGCVHGAGVAGYGNACLQSQLFGEVEAGRFQVPGQSGQLSNTISK